MTPATLDQASKEDLRDELLRIKQREKKLKDDTKEKSQKAIGAALTITTAGVLGYVIGGRVRTEKDKTDFADATEDQQEQRIKDAANVGPVPIDLLVGLGGVLLGITDAAGDFSPFFLAAGTGGVSSFATREAYHRAETQKQETPAP